MCIPGPAGRFCIQSFSLQERLMLCTEDVIRCSRSSLARPLKVAVGLCMVMALLAGSPPSLSAAVGPARRSVMDVLAIVAQHLAWVFLSWSACCLTGKYGSSGAAQQVLEPRSFIIVKSHRRLLQVQGHQKSRMFRELVRVVSFKLCCELSW